MSDLTSPKDVYFFVSALFHQNFGEEVLTKLLEEKFGHFYLMRSSFFPMKEYYSKEMGDSNSLSRLVFLFPSIHSRENLVQYKVWADCQERQTSINDKRVINLDVGYLSLENVVLATGKQFSHRIYLSNGVFADLNLVFENNTFKKLAWTYPDYSHEDFINFFNWSRSLLLKAQNNS